MLHWVSLWTPWGGGSTSLLHRGLFLDTLGWGTYFFAAPGSLSGHLGGGEVLLCCTGVSLWTPWGGGGTSLLHRLSVSASTIAVLVFIPSACLPGQTCSVRGDVSILCSTVFQAPSLAQLLGLSDHGVRQQPAQMKVPPPWLLHSGWGRTVMGRHTLVNVQGIQGAEWRLGGEGGVEVLREPRLRNLEGGEGSSEEARV